MKTLKEYENHKVQEYKEMQMFLPTELHTDVKLAAFAAGVTMKQFIVTALLEAVRRQREDS